MIRGVGLRGAREPAAASTSELGHALRLFPAGWPGSAAARHARRGEQIRRRPVDRSSRRWRRWGRVEARSGRLPLVVRGGALHGASTGCRSRARRSSRRCSSPAPLAEGPTTVLDPQPTRAHTERMLAAMGADIVRDGARVTVMPAGACRCPTSRSPATRARRRSFRRRAASGLRGPRRDVAATGRAPASSDGGGWARGRGRARGARGRARSSRPAARGLHGPPPPPSARTGRTRDRRAAARGCSGASPRARRSSRAPGAAREGDRPHRRPRRGLTALGTDTRPRRRLRVAEGGRGRPDSIHDDHRLAMIGATPASARARGWRSSAWTRRRSLPHVRARPRAPAGMIVAIDGPVGAGKSTTARAVARALGFPTSTAARSTAPSRSPRSRTARAAPPSTPPSSTSSSASACGSPGATSRLDPRPPRQRARLRVAADPRVRAALVERQRALVADGDWVAEGRDIGTVVAPGAEVKVFLVATPPCGRAARARARRRPRRDPRPAGRARRPRPRARALAARAAPDATLLDTTALRPERWSRVVELVREAPRAP